MVNLKINELISLSSKPDIFTPGESLFWNDPYISKQMLSAHLDPKTDRASYRPETIEKIVKFTIRYMGLKKDGRILDTGCGPGLYCERFKNAGFNVAGMDISENSISYAKESAEKKGIDITYINENYLDMDFKNEFDAVFIISQDFCVLSKSNREIYLKNVFNALKPGGYFVFDTSTPYSEKDITICSNWNAYNNGFWSSKPNLVLEKRFYYEEETTYLNQYTVITNEDMKVYRIYQIHYTKESIKELLISNGFKSIDIFEDLTGSKYAKNSKTLGVIAQK